MSIGMIITNMQKKINPFRFGLLVQAAQQIIEHDSDELFSVNDLSLPQSDPQVLTQDYVFRLHFTRSGSDDTHTLVIREMRRGDSRALRAQSDSAQHEFFLENIEHDNPDHIFAHYTSFAEDGSDPMFWPMVQAIREYFKKCNEAESERKRAMFFSVSAKLSDKVSNAFEKSANIPFVFFEGDEPKQLIRAMIKRLCGGPDNPAQHITPRLMWGSDMAVDHAY